MTATLLVQSGAEQRQAAKAPRYLGVEVLRIASCTGIVWYHAKAPGMQIGYAGLPALMAISVALAATHATGDLKTAATKRFSRLMVPWFFWSGIYLAIALLKLAAGKNTFGWYMLLSGPSLPLWFLPAAFIVTTLVSTRQIARRNDRVLLFWLAATILSVPVSAILLRLLPPHLDPISDWVFIAPSVLIGLALASVKEDGSWVRLVTIALCLAGACVLVFQRLPEWSWIAYFVGGPVTAFAWGIRRSAGPVITRVAMLSFGVYLVHPAVLTLAGATLASKGGAVYASTAVAGSLLAAAALAATPLRRFI